MSLTINPSLFWLGVLHNDWTCLLNLSSGSALMFNIFFAFAIGNCFFTYSYSVYFILVVN